MATYELNTTALAAGQLFCLVDLGDGDGIRRASETDLTPRTPFSVDPAWYEAYWYRHSSGSTRSEAGTMLRRSHAIARRVTEKTCHAIARKASSLVSRSAAGGGKVAGEGGAGSVAVDSGVRAGHRPASTRGAGLVRHGPLAPL